MKHSVSRIISVGRFSLLLVLLQPVSTSKPFQTVEGRHLVGGTPPFPPKSLLAKRVTHEKQRYEEDLKQEFGLRHSSKRIVEIFACLLNSGKRMVRTTRGGFLYNVRSPNHISHQYFGNWSMLRMLQMLLRLRSFSVSTSCDL